MIDQDTTANFRLKYNYSNDTVNTLYYKIAYVRLWNKLLGVNLACPVVMYDGAKTTYALSKFGNIIKIKKWHYFKKILKLL